MTAARPVLRKRDPDKYRLSGSACYRNVGVLFRFSHQLGMVFLAILVLVLVPQRV